MIYYLNKLFPRPLVFAIILFILGYALSEFIFYVGDGIKESQVSAFKILFGISYVILLSGAFLGTLALGGFNDWRLYKVSRPVFALLGILVIFSLIIVFFMAGYNDLIYH